MEPPFTISTFAVAFEETPHAFITSIRKNIMLFSFKKIGGNDMTRSEALSSIDCTTELPPLSQDQATDSWPCESIDAEASKTNGKPEVCIKGALRMAIGVGTLGE